MKWISATLLAGLAMGGYYAYPLLVVLFAPLCAVFFNPIQPGQVISTPRNTVICPTISSIKGLAGKSARLIDLPPWLLVRNGCYPAPNVTVEVVDVDGRFVGVHLLRAENKQRVWWTMTPNPTIVHG